MANNAATKTFVSGDDTDRSGWMSPYGDEGNISYNTTVPKGTSSASPNFNGTNVPGAQNIPASGYSKTWGGK